MTYDTEPIQRLRASGLVRTVIVSTATLSILLVCFWIYQSSQSQSEVATPPQAAREAPRRTEPPVPSPADIPMPSVETERAVLGPGEKIRMTFYPPKGNRARVELAVSSWTPVEGVADEFLLMQPDVRMRTRDGHAVQVTADRGVLEAERKNGGGLIPNRGAFTGHVVIQYDRLSEAQRAARPPEERNHIDPAEMVRVEMDKMEFDLEYSKLVVPGRLHLWASDVELDTVDLEIRFNESENRVDQMRINRGGRLLLREQIAGALPELGADAPRRLTLAEWLSASLQAQLDTAQPAPAAVEAPPATSAVTLTDEGVPIFDPNEEKAKAPEPPVRYFARFEGDISVTQRTGDATRSTLQGDTLEIVREFSDEELVQPSPTPSPVDHRGEAKAPRDERIVLTWSERLVVEACSPDDPRCSGDARSTITATGSPARMSLPQGSAVCSKLIFKPDGSKVWLYGTESAPAVVDLADQGTLSGRTISSQRLDHRFLVHVAGPGRLVRPTMADAPSLSASTSDPPSRSEIAFSKSLEAWGRFEKRTRIDRTARITTQQQQVLDRAIFTGRVRMHEGQTELDADSVTLQFKAGGLGASQRYIERVTGFGHVTLAQGKDTLTCHDIDIAFSNEPGHRTSPSKATARGDIVAKQGSRTIRAREQLIVDFKTVHRPSPSSRSRETVAENQPREELKTQVSRLQAVGQVFVVDPSQRLEVSAKRVDCAIEDGQKIQDALVRGTEEHPATVKLETYAVTGERILLNLPDQSAEVPGPGRLTFLSGKDLDGRKVSKPIPIVINWSDRMEFHGSRNRSLFSGRVHATSQSTTTFDCDQLVVEFEDVAKTDPDHRPSSQWAFLKRIIDRFPGRPRDDSLSSAPTRFSKEPTSILATGHAVLLTSDYDPVSGALKDRARISGPKLSVNLRPEVSKMLIEGAGNLLLEDLRPAKPSAAVTPRGQGGLFRMGEDEGPSTTLIEWNDQMWYDFSKNQTRFDGHVRLKYFSGSELLRLLHRPALVGTDPDASGPGRATFLTSDVLKVDFMDRTKSASPHGNRRIGRLSSEQLRQFEASGSVVLQDETQGLHVLADRVVYWKESDLLGVYGTDLRKARIATQKPGELPNRVSVKRLFYNLRTGQMEVTQPTVSVH